MARLIEIQDPQAGPPGLRVQVGDLIVVAATGGYVRDGSTVVELLGAFVPGVATPSGEVVVPAGPPSRVVIRALRLGSAIVEVNSGDPYGGHIVRARLSIEVKA